VQPASHSSLCPDFQIGNGVKLSRYEVGNQEADRRNAVVMRQLERMETVLVGLGKLHNRAYTKREKEILEGLGDPDKFESFRSRTRPRP
jgi:hypothetical protein